MTPSKASRGVERRGPSTSTPDTTIPYGGAMGTPLDANGDGYADLLVSAAWTGGPQLMFFAGSASGLPTAWSGPIDGIESLQSGVVFVAN